VAANRELFVKICGLRDAGSARVAVEAGADALGFILAESRRKVEPALIAEIAGELRADGLAVPDVVGVTVNAAPSEIAQSVEDAGLNMVQLSGDEMPDILGEIDVPVIKALRFAFGTTLDEAFGLADAWLSGARPASRIIVEGHAEGSYGGTGTRADWEFVARIAERYPITLAGGLTPDNVAEAISVVQPAGVDVSSGVESDGAKDHRKIRSFIERARRGATTHP
jgi:phosphoribosylanthranilate isomerase